MFDVLTRSCRRTTTTRRHLVLFQGCLADLVKNDWKKLLLLLCRQLLGLCYWLERRHNGNLLLLEDIQRAL